jgi:hypothetical protein
LVVIAIISLLVSILLPSLTRAKDLARQTVCMTNLHGLGLAMVMYQHDFTYVPRFFGWADNYIHDRAVMICPADPDKGLRMLAGGMEYPYWESRFDLSVPNSYWNFLSWWTAWQGSPSVAQDLADEMATEEGQGYCFARCHYNHPDGLIICLTPSGRVVLYDGEAWLWPEWYYLEGY